MNNENTMQTTACVNVFREDETIFDMALEYILIIYKFAGYSV